MRPMREISSFSTYVTEWVLDHPEILCNNQETIQTSKEYLKAELKKMDILYRGYQCKFSYALPHQ